MALSNEQLLLLDTLIYTKYVSNNKTVAKIIKEIEEDDYKINGCEMNSTEWEELVAIIKEDETLLSYTATNYVDEKSGMRAVCFVDDVKNPTDINVVFRGTSGDYEWEDNGRGGYLSDTEQQKLAADYVNGLPEAYGSNMAVTGHSKGGNKAQYVTVVTDRIGRCVSYDGQGFSEEFLEKYADEIAEKSQRIVSISAENDYVNCLLYPVAGTWIYIDTQVYAGTERLNNPLYYHKPNILLDGNGKLLPETEQSDVSKLINEYTTYMISNLDEPERSSVLDGVINVVIAVLGKDAGEIIKAVVENDSAEKGAISHIDDFAFDYIGEHYGLKKEVLITYIAAVIFPGLFMDDLLNSGKKVMGQVTSHMKELADKIRGKLDTFGEKASEYAKKFASAAAGCINKIEGWVQKTFNTGYQYACANPYISVNTGILRNYADRLQQINQRIAALDRRLDALYMQVGLFDLWSLIQADMLTGYSWRLGRCISYLNDTAYEFEEAERIIVSQ